MGSDSEKKIYINKGAVLENISRIKKRLQQHSCELAISTKSLKLNNKLLELIDKTFHIYEIKIRNIKLLRDNNYHLISRVHFGEDSSVLISTIDELRNLSGKTCENLYLFFEFGDNREGLRTSEISTVINLLPKIKFNKVVVASNIGCLSELRPDNKYIEQFLNTKYLFEKEGITIYKFSIGGSNCISILDKIVSNCEIELRVGEAIFFGTYDDMSIEGIPLNQENIFLEANLLRRINANIGLYNFGYCDIEPNDTISSKYIIIKQSANYSLVKTNNEVENTILLPLKYRGLSKLSEQEDTKIYLS